MTDAQDTIDLPVFGLTLPTDPGHAAELGWYALGTCGIDGPFARISCARAIGMIAVHVRRGGVSVSYYVQDDDGVDAACAALLAEMTPDDVAAIRALGER